LAQVMYLPQVTRTVAGFENIAARILQCVSDLDADCNLVVGRTG
jgi:hypothetical protein